MVPIMSDTSNRESGNRRSIGARLSRLVERTSNRRNLTFVSFLESTFVPIPLELILAPLMVRRNANAFLIAFWVLVGCVAGALFFYGLGALLFDPVVKPALEYFGQSEATHKIKSEIGNDGVFWTVFVISLTPAPLQAATLGAGLAQANILYFTLAIVLSRGLRYFGFAAIMHFAGRPALAWIQRRQNG